MGGGGGGGEEGRFKGNFDPGPKKTWMALIIRNNQNKELFLKKNKQML